jgi:hypothetical protein
MEHDSRCCAPWESPGEAAALRRNATENLEQRGSVPRMALQGAAVLLGRKLHLVHIVYP